jgi:hypothetical protein
MHTVRLAALSMKGKRKLEGVVPAMRHADRVRMLHRVRMDARMRRGARIKNKPNKPRPWNRSAAFGLFPVTLAGG